MSSQLQYQLDEIALIHSCKNKHHRPQRLTPFPASPYWLQNILIALLSRSNATKENACQNGILESCCQCHTLHFHFPKLVWSFSVMLIKQTTISHLIMIIH